MAHNFRKMHGLGNDFVIIDARDQAANLTPGQIVKIADRRRGVGCDQLITLSSDVEADIFMRIYNPDGSESGACGNATRCVADLVLSSTGADKCVIRTIAGTLSCARTARGIAVDMGCPGLAWNEIPLAKQCDTLKLPLAGDPVGVSMGNPHCVYICEDADAVDVDKIGVKIERNPLFPQRTNVEFVSLLGVDHLRMRVWERGAGITPACGTGACVAAVAAIRRGLTGRAVTVSLDGGDLWIEWRESDGHVVMTGPASYSFDGVLTDGFFSGTE